MQDYDLLEPADNAALGAAYLAGLIKRAGGDLLLALMSYNGGPTRVMRLRSQSPGLPADLFLEGLTMPETRDYGRKVLAAAAVYGYLMEGREFAATIEAFLPGFPSRWAN
jgi:soluble lytic murein transglycosylase